MDKDQISVRSLTVQSASHLQHAGEKEGVKGRAEVAYWCRIDVSMIKKRLAEALVRWPVCGLALFRAIAHDAAFCAARHRWGLLATGGAACRVLHALLTLHGVEHNTSAVAKDTQQRRTSLIGPTVPSPAGSVVGGRLRLGLESSNAGQLAGCQSLLVLVAMCHSGQQQSVKLVRGRLAFRRSRAEAVRGEDVLEDIVNGQLLWRVCARHDV